MSAESSGFSRFSLTRPRGELSLLLTWRTARVAAQARSRPAHSRMTLPSPYTTSLVDKAFRGMPNGLHFESLARAFKWQHGKASPETATRRCGVRSTLFLIGIDGNALLTASAMRPEESKTAAGRAAWRRHRRLAWYLWQGMRHRRSDTGPLLLLADLDDVSDGDISDGRTDKRGSTDGNSFLQWNGSSTASCRPK